MWIVQISDIHYSKDRPEEVGLLTQEFFIDLQCMIRKHEIHQLILVVTGDIALSGDSQDQYSCFSQLLKTTIDDLATIDISVVAVPGNHDISRKAIQSDKINHDAVLNSTFSEVDFNNYVTESNSILNSKLQNYFLFEDSIVNYGVGAGTPWGAGHIINDIGIYCLNSAIFCSGDSKKDFGNLRADTRNIRQWVNESSCKTRVLAMHHPANWFEEDTKKEIEIIAHKYFDLVLTGHEHDQVASISERQGDTAIFCKSPALHHSKKENLGYVLIEAEESGKIKKAMYRSWTQHQSFVSGAAFANSDDGCIYFDKNTSTSAKSTSAKFSFAKNIYTENLKSALQCFPDQPEIWVSPQLSTLTSPTTDKKLTLEEILNSDKSVHLKSPEGFGASCLSLHIAKELLSQGTSCIRLDCNGLKPYKLEKTIDAECKRVEIEKQQLQVIVLDSYNFTDKEHTRIFQTIEERFQNHRLILFSKTSIGIKISAQFVCPNTGLQPIQAQISHLSRSEIRIIVEKYNAWRDVGEDQVVLDRITSDIKTFNLHRTPLNCLLLLKALEVDFDENPVNRTEIIKRVLFLLFNSEDIPRYKTTPDLKDCEFILGDFAAHVMRDNQIEFSRSSAISHMSKYCEKAILDIDIHQLFDMLVNANIIAHQSNDEFCFKFSYWLLYFGALHMHQSKAFRNYIFEGARYASHPELMEYYTGIDRKRNDALKKVNSDLLELNNMIREKLGNTCPSTFFERCNWSPSVDAIESMQGQLEQDVQESNLPSSVKDNYADRQYDPSAPFDQTVNVITRELLMNNLVQSVRAGSRALRNSDYASPELKKELLETILSCWETITATLLVLAPVLAANGNVVIEGVRFNLTDSFDKYTGPEKTDAIVRTISENIIDWFCDDIYSEKMGKLFKLSMQENRSSIMQHQTALLLSRKRPSHWKGIIYEYIKKNDKNSYYLGDIEHFLFSILKLSDLQPEEIKEITYLRKAAWAKHETGAKAPGKKLIGKIKSSK